MLAVLDVFPSAQKLQGYSADAAFDTDATESAEVQKGVDDQLSYGWVPTIKRQTITLQADSASIQMFETWIGAMEAAREVITCAAVIVLPGLQREYTLTNGVLTSHMKMPGVRKIMQPRTFIISWDQITSAPLGA